MNNVPVLDRSYLHELTDGELEFQHELLGTYRTSVANILPRLEAALSAGELAAIVREAHALRGASLNIGAIAMGQCAAAIEAAARDGDLTGARQVAQRLDAEELALWAELDRM